MQASLKTIIIFCADVEKLVQFYQQYFGLTIMGEANAHWTVLDAGAVQLAFHKIGEQFMPSSTAEFKVQDSNVKLVFEIDTDLAAFRQTLLDKKVAMGDIKHFTGAAYIACDGKDPEGNIFQLVQQLS
ncbi:VOC family protein [Ferruginibacter sp.]